MRRSYHYRERDEAFGALCTTLRARLNVHQVDLAGLLGVSERAIQTWEGGAQLSQARASPTLHRLVCRAASFYQRARTGGSARLVETGARQSPF